VGGPARDACPRGRGLLEAQDPLDLAQLGVRILELGRLPHEDIDPDPVPDCHFVHQSAEVELELGDARGQLIAAPA
jgi:hypothetical protein